MTHPHQGAGEGADEPEAMILFEIEAFWDDQSTTIVRYIEAPDIRTAMELVPEETPILRINTLGGLYRTARRATPLPPDARGRP